MSENKYILIEFMRQVYSAENPYDGFRFFLLGSFDAMTVETCDSIQDLKLEYENKLSKKAEQVESLSVYDRQPLFLYSPSSINDLEEKDSIFCRSGIYAKRPLVLTLLQLDKLKMAENKNFQTPADIVDTIKEMLHNSSLPKDVGYQIFWNLGESDIAIIFRPAKFNDLAEVMHEFRTGALNKEYLIIISTSSHCAFPKPEQQNSRKGEINKNLTVWLKAELSDSKTEFITFGNTTPYNRINQNVHFLFGEWDYRVNFKTKRISIFEKELASRHQRPHSSRRHKIYPRRRGRNLTVETAQLVDYLESAFLHLWDKEPYSNNSFPFKASYTIPELSVPLHYSGSTDCEFKKDEQSIARARPFGYWQDTITEPTNKLCAVIEKYESLVTKQRKTELIQLICSFKNTVIGMSQFLFRLQTGRYEEDLYAYIQPVFERLRPITYNYAENVEYLLNKVNLGMETRQAERFISRANDLINEYIDNTSDLIENLQHLFSIMAVSPHTYLETYGSNMRSLAAADKLLDAYQGIVSFLKENFPDTIQNNQKTNREILVFPYRKAQSQHTLLFNNSNPINRLSYISLDFTQMFDIQSTIFMLLHECGHHLGDRLREERFYQLSQASIYLAYEWIIGDYIAYPLEFFLSRAYDSSLSLDSMEKVQSNLFACLDRNSADKLKGDYSYKISNTVSNFIKESYVIDKQLLFKAYSIYSNVNKLSGFNKVLYDEYFSEQVLSFLMDMMIPQYLGVSPTKPKLQTISDNLRIIRNNNIQHISNHLGKDLHRIAGDLAEEIRHKDGNVREALRIKAVYDNTDVFARNLFQNTSAIIESEFKNSSLQKLYSVFSDVYSDLFAIKLLNADAEQYLKVFGNILGINRAALPENDRGLVRIYTVIKALWPNRDNKWVADILLGIEDPSLPSEQREIVLKKWKMLELRAFMPSLQKYAEDCRDKLDSLLEKSKKDETKEKSLEMLHKMFTENASDLQAEGIYHFYRYLMNH